VLFGFFLSFLILEAGDLGDTEVKGHVAIELLGPSVDHLKVADGGLEELPDVLRVFLCVIVCSHVYLRYEDLIEDRLWRKQFGDFEVVDKELVTLIIEGEIEVDQFVDIEIL
jgi:hypothetical protein